MFNKPEIVPLLNDFFAAICYTDIRIPARGTYPCSHIEISNSSAHAREMLFKCPVQLAIL